MIKLSTTHYKEGYRGLTSPYWVDVSLDLTSKKIRIQASYLYTPYRSTYVRSEVKSITFSDLARHKNPDELILEKIDEVANLLFSS